MLASINLQPSTVDFADESLNTAKLLPDEAAGLRASFADLLRPHLDPAQMLEVTDGGALPPGGNRLPVTDFAESANAIDPEPDPREAATTAHLAAPLSPIPVPYPAAGDAAPPQAAGAHQALSATFDVLPPVQLNGGGAPPRSQLMAASPAMTMVQPEAPLETRMPVAPVSSATGPAKLTPNAIPGGLPLRVERPGRGQTTLGEAIGTLSRAAPAETSAQPRNQDVERIRRLFHATSHSGGNERSLPASLETTAAQSVDALRSAAGDTVPARPLDIVTGSLNAAQMLRAAPAETAQAAMRALPPIDVPVQDTVWGDRVGERVLIMAGNRLQNAEIRLTPAEMGPVRVQVMVEDGAANVTFLAQHAVTREALEQALPRLREMLADNGIQLGQTSVSGEGVAQGERDGNADVPNRISVAVNVPEESGRDELAVPSEGSRRGNALVDTFV